MKVKCPKCGYEFDIKKPVIKIEFDATELDRYENSSNRSKKEK